MREIGLILARGKHALRSPRKQHQISSASDIGYYQFSSPIHDRQQELYLLYGKVSWEFVFRRFLFSIHLFLLVPSACICLCLRRVCFNEWTLLLLWAAACLQLWTKLSGVFGTAPAFRLSFLQRRRGGDIGCAWCGLRDSRQLAMSPQKHEFFLNLLRQESMETKCLWKRTGTKSRW